MCIFTKFIEAKISIAREPATKNAPPPMKKVKLEDLEAAAVRDRLLAKFTALLSEKVP
jgi:hypothetical protein